MPPKKTENKNLKNESVAELPPPETSDNFLSTMKLRYKTLEKWRKQAEKGMALDYGTYEMKGSSGRDFEVQSIWFPIDPDKDPSEIQQSFLHIIAIDKATRKLAAVREVDFGTYDYKSGETLNDVRFVTARGEIDTRYRGIGAASVTDKVLVKVLEKMATQYSDKRLSIVWKVTNANRYRLGEAVQELAKTELMEPSKEKDEKIKILKEEISIRQDEQERWQSLYGPNGKFGFDGNSEDGEKTIKPNKNLEDFKPKNMGLDKYDILTEKVRQASLK